MDELPVIQLIYGEYDGHDLTFRTMQPSELGGGLEAPSEGLGVVEEPLVEIPSMSCVTCTGTSYVAFSNASGGKRAITNGAVVTGVPIWSASDVGNCGAVPTTGVCQQVRMRNLYPQQLERVYARITSLTVTGTTTAVSIPAQPFAGVADFGLPAPAATNGLWRAGEIGRNSPAGSAGGGVLTWWAFNGSTPPGELFRYSFVVQVHGLIVSPTRRASLADTLLDDAALDYPARTTVAPVSAHVAISEDQRFVAFAASSGGNFVYRKDLTTGALVRVNPVSCTTATNPHISADGSVVVFQASGCDLTGVGTTTTSAQIYAYDFAASTMTLVSANTTGGYAGGASQAPRVNSDGNIVVFQSSAINLMPGTPASGRPGCVEVYRFDRLLGTLSHVSATQFSDISVPTDGWATGCTGSVIAGDTPDVSGDGNLVVFSSALPLDTADTNPATRRRDIYVYDQAATDSAAVAIVYRVSLASSGAELSSGTGSFTPTLSSDGAYLAFATDATNVIAAESTTAARRHIYRRSTAEGADSSILRVTRRVDRGEPSQTTTGIPALSSSGRFVAFWSAANDLAAAGTFSVPQQEVYVCDMQAPVAALQRCWVASTMQPTAAGSFSALNGAVSAASRIALAYPSDIDAGYVVYQAAPTGGTWGTFGGGGQQVLVSPVGDPRYQQPAVAP